MPIRNFTGERYGRLLVVCRAQTPPHGRNAFWHCICDCGNTVAVAAANLGKNTLSCGCYQKECATQILTGNTYQRTHNRSKTPEHSAWVRMLQRCYNPKDRKFNIYGGRNISVCDRWRDRFEAFYTDMGPRPSSHHSLDRINNDGNYEPSNCRWATATEQCGNRSVSRKITVDNITLHLAAWCRALNIKPWKLYDLTKSYNGDPPRFPSMETAIQHFLHEQQKGHR